jgi:hypothetical protein
VRLCCALGLTWERPLDVLCGPEMNRKVMMSAIRDQRADIHRATSALPSENPITPWRLEIDPFANASPLIDLSLVAGGLPDDRDAEDILRDLDCCRMKRAPW